MLHNFIKALCSSPTMLKNRLTRWDSWRLCRETAFFPWSWWC